MEEAVKNGLLIRFNIWNLCWILEAGRSIETLTNGRYFHHEDECTAFLGIVARILAYRGDALCRIPSGGNAGTNAEFACLPHRIHEL